MVPIFLGHPVDMCRCHQAVWFGTDQWMATFWGCHCDVALDMRQGGRAVWKSIRFSVYGREWPKPMRCAYSESASVLTSQEHEAFEPNAHRWRRRDETVELSRVSGVYWTLLKMILKIVMLMMMISQRSRAEPWRELHNWSSRISCRRIATATRMYLSVLF